MSKYTAILIPDKFTWILGTIAKEIVRHNPDMAFAYATRDEVRHQPERVVKLASRVNLLHWIVDLEFFQSLPMELADFPRTVASVHHVIDWDQAQKCRSARLIHTVSTEWRDYLIEHGIPAEKIWVIPNGVDTVCFNPSLSYIEARRRFGLPASAFVVGFFGSAHVLSRPRKGVDVFIKAARQLQGYIPELWLFISGQNWDSDVAALRQAGLNVFYPGFLPARQLPAAYRTLDTFVVASTIEGGPVTAFESMACGVPLISTSVGMVRDAVQNRQHALIIPANQPEALVDAVKTVYGDLDLMQHLRQNALTLVKQQYLWEHVAPRYGDLYRQALGDCSTASTVTDPFIRQRQVVLERDMVVLLVDTWNQKHRHEALRLLWEDNPGFGRKVSVLRRWAGLWIYDLAYKFYRNLGLGFVKTRLKRWIGS